MTSRLLNGVVSRAKPLSLYKNVLTPIIKRAESTIPYESKVKSFELNVTETCFFLTLCILYL